MISFPEEVKVSFPEGLSLPGSFEALFHWMEANRFIHRYSGGRGRYASLYPEEQGSAGSSLVLFEPIAPYLVETWAAGRLAPLVRTGGDGSRAALWRDDDGRLRFVHLGSGSGSTMLCKLTDDRIDFLRLLAIGYEELCWPDDFGLTPQEAYCQSHDEDEEPFVPPLQFRSWVETTFGVEVPATAAEIVTRTASMIDQTSEDPFWLWVQKMRGW